VDDDKAILRGARADNDGESMLAASEFREVSSEKMTPHEKGGTAFVPFTNSPRGESQLLVTKGLATARVIEFRVSQRADDVATRMAKG
jgi:hypothetical protein